MSLLVFDIETVPDVRLGRKLMRHLIAGDATDAEVAKAMFDAQLEKTQGKSNFLKHNLHQVVAISVAYRNEKAFKVASLGTEASSEADLIRAFFDIIEKQKPTLVDWNGGGFDLPVLHFRSMLHGIQAFTYWNTGGDAKWENYQDRYRGRHCDVMDVLGRFNVKASLDEICIMLGFPGKLDMDGSKVCDSYFGGEIKKIRDYCDHDVLSTYLVFLRFEMIRGRFSPEQYAAEVKVVRDYLNGAESPHFAEYLAAWDAAA